MHISYQYHAYNMYIQSVCVCVYVYVTGLRGGTTCRTLLV